MNRLPNRALVRGALASVVVLAGASACSRSNRADAGRDTTQTGAVAPADTQGPASQGNAAIPAPAADTAQTSTVDTGQTSTAKPGRLGTRVHPGTDSSAKRSDKDVSGYRSMARDTTDTTHIRPTADSGVSAAPTTDSTAASASAEVAPQSANKTDTASTEMAAAAVPADTTAQTQDTTAQAQEYTWAAAGAGVAAAGDTSSEMARDTSVAPEQTDTVAVAAADTSAIAVQADTTTHAEIADSNAEVASADSVADQRDRIRPPEDSTEISGQVSTDEARADVKTGVDSVGAAPLDNAVSGSEAVALLSRAGQPCTVNRDSWKLFWDLADSPAGMNPCGTGTMTLPRTWTGER